MVLPLESTMVLSSEYFGHGMADQNGNLPLHAYFGEQENALLYM